MAIGIYWARYVCCRLRGVQFCWNLNTTHSLARYLRPFQTIIQDCASIFRLISDVFGLLCVSMACFVSKCINRNSIMEHNLSFFVPSLSLVIRKNEWLPADEECASRKRAKNTNHVHRVKMSTKSIHWIYSKCNRLIAYFVCVFFYFSLWLFSSWKVSVLFETLWTCLACEKLNSWTESGKRHTNRNQNALVHFIILASSIQLHIVFGVENNRWSRLEC